MTSRTPRVDDASRSVGAAAAMTSRTPRVDDASRSVGAAVAMTPRTPRVDDASSTCSTRVEARRGSPRRASRAPAAGAPGGPDARVRRGPRPPAREGRAHKSRRLLLQPVLGGVMIPRRACRFLDEAISFTRRTSKPSAFVSSKFEPDTVRGPGRHAPARTAAPPRVSRKRAPRMPLRWHVPPRYLAKYSNATYDTTKFDSFCVVRDPLEKALSRADINH